jgi:uncharacterized protein YyaL (SSP411 family)
MKLAGIVLPWVKGHSFTSFGLSRWKASTPILIGVALVALAVSGDAGILTTGDSTKQTTTTGAVPPNQTKNQHQYTNRLIHEQSPYLLLHAHNPVDWYPWGEEAFAKAKRENKPIFLSVGYYTCHWCHVMERESYSNPAIAVLLNRWFISIKVDREERPDIDSEYMNFVEATTGSGGWPMNVFLTPDLKPFFGGTYFPPDDKYDHVGLRTLLPRIAELWAKQHDKILRSADEIAQKLQQAVDAGAGGGNTALQAALLDKTYEQIRLSYDAAHGAFGEAPLFPRPVVPDFLLRYWSRTGKKDALDMVLNNLRSMAAGGVHDQIGGGFHRYSTDGQWRVPHFEKMLYDQAQLAMLYTEAYQATNDPFYGNVARNILDFALREMRSPEGAFYSALDADSPLEKGKPEHGEGVFYVWTVAEIEQVLGKDAASIFNFCYGVEAGGNVPSGQDIEGWLKGKNVLYESHSLGDGANKFGKTEVQISQILTDAKQKLFAYRSLRPTPPVDTKIITSWNGLMISALAKASQVLDEPKYLEAANRARSFLEAHLYQATSGKLKRRYRAGSAEIDGFLDDYTFLNQGLLDLYEASFDVRLLSWAMRLQQTQDHLFWDARQGGYFTTSGRDQSILLRTREAYDGVEPSPNSVAAMNLLRLWQITDLQGYKDKADKTLAAFGPGLEQRPEAMPYMISTLGFSLVKPRQIVIAGAPGAEDTRALLRLVWQRYLPNRVLLLADGAEGQKQLAHWVPSLATVTRRQGRATAYICENYICNLPTGDPPTVARLLDGFRPGAK